MVDDDVISIYIIVYQRLYITLHCNVLQQLFKGVLKSSNSENKNFCM